GNKRGNAAHAVAASARFRAVIVVDSHRGIGLAARRIERHQLVIGLLSRGGASGGRFDRLRRAAQIDDDDLVAETVHLDELAVRQSADIRSAHDLSSHFLARQISPQISPNVTVYMSSHASSFKSNPVLAAAEIWARRSYRGVVEQFGATNIKDERAGAPSGERDDHCSVSPRSWGGHLGGVGCRAGIWANTAGSGPLGATCAAKRAGPPRRRLRRGRRAHRQDNYLRQRQRDLG